MANNTFTETFADGTALTQTQLETALQSLKLDISNSTLLTSGSTSGTFLKSNGDGAAASFGTVPDPLGPSSLRNYGLSASASAGALTVALKTNALADPSSGDKVNLTFSSNGSTSATYTAVDVSAALSLAITASASLGFTATSTSRIHVYAINNAGTAKLAVSARSDLDTGATVTTTAVSSGADTSTILYASAALTVVPRLLGYVEAAHNSTGSWQTPTKVNITNNANLTNTVTANQLLGAANSSASLVSGLANNVVNTYTRSTGTGTTTLGVRSVAITATSGTFSTANTSDTSVTNLSTSLTTSGRPVFVGLQSEGDTISFGAFIQGSTNDATFSILRGATVIAEYRCGHDITVPPSSLWVLDAVAAGTYTYSVKIRAGVGGTAYCQYTKLVAYEI